VVRRPWRPSVGAALRRCTDRRGDPALSIASSRRSHGHVPLPAASGYGYGYGCFLSQKQQPLSAHELMHHRGRNRIDVLFACRYYLPRAPSSADSVRMRVSVAGCGASFLRGGVCPRPVFAFGGGDNERQGWSRGLTCAGPEWGRPVEPLLSDERVNDGLRSISS
jgi:hypothetical protein